MIIKKKLDIAENQINDMELISEAVTECEREKKKNEEIKVNQREDNEYGGQAAYSNKRKTLPLK